LKNYVPLPVNKVIKKEELSEWQQKDYKESNIKKLVCDLNERTNYVVDYRMLKLAIELGFKITKIHRCLQYEQKPFMKSYVE
jgi:hypothetical protein